MKTGEKKGMIPEIAYEAKITIKPLITTYKLTGPVGK